MTSEEKCYHSSEQREEVGSPGQGTIQAQVRRSGLQSIYQGSQISAKSRELTYTAPNTSAENHCVHYAEGFLDFFQVIKFRFLACILVAGSARRRGLQKSSLIAPML